MNSSSTGSSKGHRGPGVDVLIPASEGKGCEEEAGGNTYPQLVVELVGVRGF